MLHRKYAHQWTTPGCAKLSRLYFAIEHQAEACNIGGDSLHGSSGMHTPWTSGSIPNGCSSIPEAISTIKDVVGPVLGSPNVRKQAIRSLLPLQCIDTW
jgi:hypothetical protein